VNPRMLLSFDLNHRMAEHMNMIDSSLSRMHISHALTSSLPCSVGLASIFTPNVRHARVFDLAESIRCSRFHVCWRYVHLRSSCVLRSEMMGSDGQLKLLNSQLSCLFRLRWRGLRIGCSTTELPRPALWTIASAEIFCQFNCKSRSSHREKGYIAQPIPHADQQEKEERPHDIFHALDGLPAAQETERNGNHQRDSSIACK